MRFATVAGAVAMATMAFAAPAPIGDLIASKDFIAEAKAKIDQALALPDLTIKRGIDQGNLVGKLTSGGGVPALNLPGTNSGLNAAAEALGLPENKLLTLLNPLGLDKAVDGVLDLAGTVSVLLEKVTDIVSPELSAQVKEVVNSVNGVASGAIAALDATLSKALDVVNAALDAVQKTGVVDNVTQIAFGSVDKLDVLINQLEGASAADPNNKQLTALVNKARQLADGILKIGESASTE